MSHHQRRDFLKKTFLSLIALSSSSIGALAEHMPPEEVIPSANRWLPEIQGAEIGFLAIGDMGTGWKTEHDLVSLMTRFPAAEYPAILLLGDLSYPSAEKNLLHQNIIDPFSPLLMRNYRFYPCWGNHDWKAEKARYVRDYFAAPDYFTFKLGPAQLWSLNTNVFDSRQSTWLEKSLAESRSAWKVVFCHHPPYSSGKVHGGSTDLVRDLCPLLSKYKVDLCLSGHDHLYERFNQIDRVNFIVSGGGSASLYDFEPETHLPRAYIKKCHHFLTINLTTKNLRIRAIDLSGQVFDQVLITKNA